MNSLQPFVKGRGASHNPPNRFEEITLERDLDWNPEEDIAPGTKLFRDTTQALINYNDSPDVGFDASINPYRGCEHGCIYCFARPTHEFLGFSAGLDFETRIMVKENAPALLRKELASKSWKPQVLVMSGVTDCYQPIERKLRLTRQCLEILLECRNPVCIITKNFLVTRDIDLFREFAKFEAVAINVSITTLDPTITPKLEPRAPLPNQRLAAVQMLAAAGIPVGVMVAPVIPGLTDHEMPSIVAACARVGASFAGYTPVRLPYGVAPLFERWLEQHFPDRKEKVLNGIRSMREGKLNDPNWGTRMRGNGSLAEQIGKIFEIARRKAGLDGPRSTLSTKHFRRPQGPQMQFELET